mgnify:CR=1 FL=1
MPFPTPMAGEKILELLFPQNIILKIVMFLSFISILSIPYLYNNFSSGQNFIGLIFKGVLMGLSTIYNNLINIVSLISQRMFDTLALTMFLLLFSVMAIYQLTSILVHMTDLGQSYSPVGIAVMSLIIVIALSPFAFWITGGKSISQPVQEIQNTLNKTIEQIPENIHTINIGSVYG